MLGRFERIWEFPLLAPFRASLALFLVIFALCGLRAFTGLIGSRDFSHDAFMFFDGAWRMLSGQHPHIDFYSHVGFLTYLPTAAGLWLSHGTAWGFGYGQALVGLVLGVWTYFLCRDRLTDVPRALMCVAVVLIAVAPFAIGFSPLKVSPGMIYNRQGYALIALLLTEAFQAPLSRRQRYELRGGISSGVILALLLFLKITYFAIGLFLLVALLFCRSQERQRWTGIAIGFVSVSFICCAYFRFRMSSMLHDLLLVGGGKHIHIVWYIFDNILADAAIVITVAGVAALFLRGRGAIRPAKTIFLASVVIAIAGTALILSNYEQDGFPLTAFAAILFLNTVVLQAPVVHAGEDLFRVSVLLLGSVLVFNALLSGMLGIGFATAQRILLAHKLKRFDMPRTSGFTTGISDDWYVNLVNDGLTLVKKFRRPGDTIMSLDFTNPYSYGLGMKPAHGGTTVFQFGTTFSDESRPEPEFLFGAADLVAVPLKASDPTLDDNVPRIYGPYLKSHFHVVGETEYWELYRRNGE